MKGFYSIVIAVAAVVILTFPAVADVPKTINYQGRLTDDLGAPVTSTVSMTFTIYDAETVGDSKWTETHPTVSVVDGLFNAILGAGRQGTSAAYDLAKFGDAQKIIFGDILEENAFQSAQRINQLTGQYFIRECRIAKHG